MFADPLRAALARRLVWRIDDGLSLPEPDGLRNVGGRRVELRAGAIVGLWHPADDPASQQPWEERLVSLGTEQPIDQVAREVTLADAPLLAIAAGRRLRQ